MANKVCTPLLAPVGGVIVRVYTLFPVEEKVIQFGRAAPPTVTSSSYLIEPARKLPVFAHPGVGVML